MRPGVSPGAARSVRAVLMGQKSAEVVVPAGIVMLLGRAERWELMFGSSVSRDGRGDRRQPVYSGQSKWRYW